MTTDASMTTTTDGEKAGPGVGAETSNDDSDGLARQPSAAPSVWVSETLSPAREAAFVFVICMAQFCTQAGFMGTLVLLRDMGQTACSSPASASSASGRWWPA
ncbi:hypothetical protein CDD83_6215 [Cordyceps sp. RAO-2017]|nr:hypothetical protein CDD83_6215 [Cordyceps sp. RAO-2017]